MHLRLDTASKHKIERAASYADKTLSEFVLANALEAADRLIEERETMTLDNRDRDVFFDAILNPHRPNKKLRQAMKRYDDLNR